MKRAFYRVSILSILLVMANCSNPKPETACAREAAKLQDENGFGGFSNLEDALACGEESNKPILITFTGHSSYSVRNMDRFVWADDNIRKTIANKFIQVALYVDDRTPLEESYSVAHPLHDKETQINTVGKRNQELEWKFGQISQPFYVVVDSQMKELTTGRGYTPLHKKDEFEEFLHLALKKYDELH